MNNLVLGDNISDDDMGVLYGFSLFETFLVDNCGFVFLLDRHFDRLFDSMAFFKFNIDFGRDELRQTVLKYIENSSIKNKILRITVTSGNKVKGIKPSVLLNVRENPYNKESVEKGFTLTVSKLRKDKNSIILRYKTANYLENFLEGQNALEIGFNDAIFLNMGNKITETTKCNLFFVSKGILHTPSPDCGLLPGIIREWVISSSQIMGIKCLQGSYTVEELLEADEVFVTNSVMGIMPVMRVDSTIINGGRAGEITQALADKIENKSFSN